MKFHFRKTASLLCMLCLAALFFFTSLPVTDLYGYRGRRSSGRSNFSIRIPKGRAKPKNSRGSLVYRSKRTSQKRNRKVTPKTIDISNKTDAKNTPLNSQDIIKLVKERSRKRQEQAYAQAESSDDPKAWDYDQLRDAGGTGTAPKQFWVDFYYHYWAHQSSYYYPRVQLNVRVPVLPKDVTTLTDKDTTIYYYEGIYYQGSGENYWVVTGPMHVRVNEIPQDSLYLVYDNQEYYYFYGTFYRYVEDDNSFESIPPPVGIEIPALPKGRQTVQKNGQPLYRVGNVLYRPYFRGGDIVYIVEEVG